MKRYRFTRVAIAFFLACLPALTCGVGPVLTDLLARVEALETAVDAMGRIEHGTVVLGPQDVDSLDSRVLKRDVCFSQPFAATPTVTISLRDASLPGIVPLSFTPFASTPAPDCFIAVLMMPSGYQGGHALLSWIAIGQE